MKKVAITLFILNIFFLLFGAFCIAFFSTNTGEKFLLLNDDVNSNIQQHLVNIQKNVNKVHEKPIYHLLRFIGSFCCGVLGIIVTKRKNVDKATIIMYSICTVLLIFSSSIFSAVVYLLAIVLGYRSISINKKVIE